MSQAHQISVDSRRVVRVLVVDADEETRSRYHDSLHVAGCDVVDAADGRDALVKALSVCPTIVITETRLPIFDGYALCRVLRRDSVTHRVPIVVVTTESRPTELEHARDAGADLVLTKPVPLDVLLAEIQRLLQRPEGTNEFGATRQLVTSEQRRLSQAKALRRFETTTPSAKPPALSCPSCGNPLIYERSHIGGVNSRHPEQWDDYGCEACGAFVYRHRTRKLRRAG